VLLIRPFRSYLKVLDRSRSALSFKWLMAGSIIGRNPDRRQPQSTSIIPAVGYFRVTNDY
jgi:hypothetical protein